LFKILEQSSLGRRTKFQIFSSSSEQNSNKCRTISKGYFHAYTYSCSSGLHEYKQKLHIAKPYLTSWHNSIFGLN